MFAICLILPQNKSGPNRMVKVNCCYKLLAHVNPRSDDKANFLKIVEVSLHV